MSEILMRQAFDEYKERIASLQSQLTEALKPKVCRWTTTDGDSFISSCGRVMEEWGGEPDPDVNYCWYCGGKVELMGGDDE